MPKEREACKSKSYDLLCLGLTTKSHARLPPKSQTEQLRPETARPRATQTTQHWYSCGAQTNCMHSLPTQESLRKLYDLHAQPATAENHTRKHALRARESFRSIHDGQKNRLNQNIFGLGPSQADELVWFLAVCTYPDWLELG